MVGPAAGASAPAPKRQGLWREQPATSALPRRGRRGSAGQGPVLVVESWAIVVPVQPCEHPNHFRLDSSWERVLLAGFSLVML